MAIWYVDPVNGDNTKSGNSFANRRLSINGNNTSDQPGNYFNVGLLSDGDEIRIIKSPDFTSLGNGTWTAKPKGFTLGTSVIYNCTAVKGSTTTVNCPSAHGLSTGDPVQIQYNSYDANNIQGVYEATVTSTTQFTVPVNTSSDTWTDNSTTFSVHNQLKYRCIKLTSSYTKEIAFCSGKLNKWISSNANVNGGVGNVSNFQAGNEFNSAWAGYSGARLQVVNNINQFGASGKAGYYQLPSTLDLSSYQQISFKCGFRSLASDDPVNNRISLKLCSDNNGDVVVHSIPVERSGGRSPYNFEVTKDFGTNLSNNINSVAIHVDANVVDDYMIHVEQIMACQASSSPTALTHHSVISKSNDNVNAVEHYTVADVTGNFVFFGDVDYSDQITTGGRFLYSGTSETVTTYHRTALSLNAAVQFAFYTYWFYFNRDNNVSTNGLTISGGWNETDMSTQTGHTVVDGNQGDDGVILFATQYTNFVNISKVSTSRAMTHTQNYGGGSARIEKVTAYGDQYGHFELNSDVANSVKDCFIINSDGGWQGQRDRNTTYDNCTLISAPYQSPYASSIYNKGALFKNCTMRDNNNSNQPSYAAKNNYLNCTFDDINSNIQRFSNTQTQGGGQSTVKDCTFTNYVGNFVTSSGASSMEQNDLSYCAFHNYNGTANDHRIYFNNATMFSESTVRYVNSGLAWKLSTLTTDYNSTKPFSRIFIESFVASSTQVTASIWARRTNTGMTVQLGALVADNDFDIGLTSDVITSMTAAADTWEQISISFTPPKAGKCKIRVLVYGGSTYSAYVDAPTITQV